MGVDSISYNSKGPANIVSGLLALRVLFLDTVYFEESIFLKLP